VAHSAQASVPDALPDVEPLSPAASPVNRRRAVMAGALLLVVVQLVSRWWVLAQRDFSSDDLEYAARAHEASVFSADYLLQNQEGHFMPGALLLAGTLSRLFPLEWGAVVIALLLLQLVASYAVLRLLRTVMGDRPAVLVPFIVYLVSPLALGSFTWWAAAMNSVPLQIGLAWYSADALRLTRTGRVRYAVTGTLALVLALAFYERAALIPVLAGCLVWLLLHAEGVRAPLRTAWRRGRPLWLASVPVLAGWAWLYLHRGSAEPVSSPTTAQTLDLTRSFARALVGGLVGGPWRWKPGIGSPVADPPEALVVAAAACVGLLVLWTSWKRRHGLLVWLLFSGYFVLGAGLVALGRAASEISDVLPLTYRYFASEAVVFPVALAVLFVLPPRTRAADGEPLERPGTTPPPGRRTLGPVTRVLVTVLLAVFLAGSIVSTVTHVRAWDGDVTGVYLANARAALATAGEEPLLDQEVPAAVLWSLAAPYNLASRVFLPLEDRPEFADTSSDLRVLDEKGRLVPGRVIPGVPVRKGPVGSCGWTVPPGATTAVPLEASLVDGPWTAELVYSAAADGAARVALGAGPPVDVPLRQGEHTVYVRVRGEGAALTVTAPTAGLCVSAGLVGAIGPR
jgi:hypothetical protein